MRLLLLVLIALTAFIQYPLWWGRGGWLRVQELEKQIVAQQETVKALEARNNALSAEVQDLVTGVAAVEERARTEMGMVREGEVFVELLTPNQPLPPPYVPPARNSGTARNSTR